MTGVERGSGEVAADQCTVSAVVLIMALSLILVGV